MSEEISLCPKCNCMTKTVGPYYCGKCGKEKIEWDETLEPEEQWDRIKVEMFKGGKCPESIDELMKAGLAAAPTRAEKWLRLSFCLLVAKLIAMGKEFSFEEVWEAFEKDKNDPERLKRAMLKLFKGQ